MAGRPNQILRDTYTLGAVIGRGGQGVVYQAWQRQTGAFVAIKTLKHRYSESESITAEIELLSKLDHPNIVKYFDVVEEDGRLHVVLEFMENGSLASVRKQFGNFPEAVCAKYMRQVLAGLEYLHGQGVLHRDIKAANILTSKNGVAKLADFGLAARAAAFGDASVADEVIGSPYWLPPEIIEMSAAPSAACDIWSVGCTIIELTTGRPPYFDLAPMAALFRIVQDDVPPLPEGASEALRDFLLQCFNRESVLRADATHLLTHAWLERSVRRGNSLSSSSVDDPDSTSQQRRHHVSERPVTPQRTPLPTTTTPPTPAVATPLLLETTPPPPQRRGSEENQSEDDGGSALVSLRKLTSSDAALDNDNTDKMRLSASDLDAFLEDDPSMRYRRSDFGRGSSTNRSDFGRGSSSLPTVEDSEVEIVEERDLLRRLDDATNEATFDATNEATFVDAPQEALPLRGLFESFREDDDDNYDDAFLTNRDSDLNVAALQQQLQSIAVDSPPVIITKKSPPIATTSRPSPVVDALAPYREADDDNDAYDDDFASPTFDNKLPGLKFTTGTSSSSLAPPTLSSSSQRHPLNTSSGTSKQSLDDDSDDDDDDDDDEDHGGLDDDDDDPFDDDDKSSAGDTRSWERSTSLAEINALTSDDPFATNFFDDEADFLHDDHREREAKRVEEIDTLLQRLPGGLDDVSLATLRKTEAACAALRRLIDLPGSESDAGVDDFHLGDHALAALLEAVDRAWVDQHSLDATLVVLRVVLSLVSRSPGALDQLVGLGLAPLLAGVATDLSTSPGEDLKVSSSLFATTAAIAEVVCSRGSDDALKVFVGGGGLRLLVALLLPADVENDHRVDANRWSAAKLAVDAILGVVRRDSGGPAATAVAATRRGRFVNPVSTKTETKPSRNALCSTLARLGAPPRLAGGLPAARHLHVAARRAVAGSTDAGATRRIAVAQALADRSAAALSAFCEADALVRERVAQPRTSKVVLGVLAAAPMRVALMAAEARRAQPLEEPMRVEADAHASLAVALVKALKALCMASASALDDLAKAGAIEVVVGVLGAAQRGLRGTSIDQDDSDDDVHIFVNQPSLQEKPTSSVGGGFSLDDDEIDEVVSEDDQIHIEAVDLDGIDDDEDEDVKEEPPPPPPPLKAQMRIQTTERPPMMSAAHRMITPSPSAAFPRRDELEDQLVPCLYYLCRIDRARLGRAAACGAAQRLAACVARRRHLKQFALATLCELCHAASADQDQGGTIASELWLAGGVRLYARLLAEAYWGVRALAAIAAWLGKDKDRVEKELARRTCAERVVDLLRSAQRAEFEHALPPLRDAVECSSVFAVALLRVDRVGGGGSDADQPVSPRTLLGGGRSTKSRGPRRRPHAFAQEIKRRLRRHRAALTRKALLEILRAALKAADQPRDLLINAGLVTTLQKLARDESQVLVQGLASSVLTNYGLDPDSSLPLNNGP